jgi:hypothetical protein
MVYDHITLADKFKGYSNVNQKIALEIRKGAFTKIKRGLYSDDVMVDAPVLANACISPSYLSFEYALAFYGLIPEKVSLYTSACFGKKTNKVFESEALTLSYSFIPEPAFPKGIVFLRNEAGVRYKIARPEKALCDTLYSAYPVRSLKDLKTMLFEDLRIDEMELKNLDCGFIFEIIPLYRSNTLNVFGKYMRKELTHECDKRTDR